MTTINPRRIPGNWRVGYVLDYHTLYSELIGHDEHGHPQFETKRTEVGELLYRLKYKADQTVLTELIELAAKFIAGRKLALDYVLPVPPSKPRKFQPVFALAQGLSTLLGVPFRKDFIMKVKETAELKNVYDFNERLKLLENAYRLQKVSLLAANLSCYLMICIAPVRR